MQKRLSEEEFNGLYHNLDKALKLYRVVASLIVEAPQNVMNELSIPFSDFDDLISRLDIKSTFRDRTGIALEEKLRSLARSRTLIEKINRALSQVPIVSNGRMLYEAVFETYIAPEKLSANEIASKMGIPRSSYFRYVKQGKEIIAKFIWTKDGEMLEDIDEIVDSLRLHWVTETE